MQGHEEDGNSLISNSEEVEIKTDVQVGASNRLCLRHSHFCHNIAFQINRFATEEADISRHGYINHAGDHDSND